jgi:hypothetical protein
MIYKDLAQVLIDDISAFQKSKKTKTIRDYRILMGKINQELFMVRTHHPEFINIAKAADQEYDLFSDFANALEQIKIQLQSLGDPNDK